MYVVPSLEDIKQRSQLAQLRGTEVLFSADTVLALVEMAEKAAVLERELETQVAELRLEVRDLERTCDGFEEDADNWRLAYEELKEGVAATVAKLEIVAGEGK